MDYPFEADDQHFEPRREIVFDFFLLTGIAPGNFEFLRESSGQAPLSLE
jgi:hypothetical protein